MRPFGVLALQGDFAAHGQALRELDVPVREVRRVRELSGLAGLVIPGGESTTLLNLMQDEPWFDALRRFHDEVPEVRNGLECGIKLAGFSDYEEGDVIECYELEKIQQTL